LTGTTKWSRVQMHLERIAAVVNTATPGSHTEVEIPFRSRRCRVALGRLCYTYAPSLRDRRSGSLCDLRYPRRSDMPMRSRWPAPGVVYEVAANGGRWEGGMVFGLFPPSVAGGL
jgi:hypothetical protein